MAKRRALVLLSGGLDSMLAAKILLVQGIEVNGLIFKSYFFDSQKGKEAARQLGISFRVVNFAKKHLVITKKPDFGHGRAANPCIDCHLLMLKQAKKILEKEGWDFVATGEILGQRPFSQNKNALALIAKKSGLANRLLRPLSAKLLPPTLPEKKDWVDRDELLAIRGRSRKTQIKLAKKYQLSFPQPAGGCILTEKEFGKKFFDLLQKWPQADGDDIALLKFGRHFWKGKALIILGKNQEENEKLAKLKKAKDILIEPQDFPGPTALIRGSNHQKAAGQAKELILRYTKKLPTEPDFTLSKPV